MAQRSRILSGAALADRRILTGPASQSMILDGLDRASSAIAPGMALPPPSLQSRPIVPNPPLYSALRNRRTACRQLGPSHLVPCYRGIPGSGGHINQCRIFSRPEIQVAHVPGRVPWSDGDIAGQAAHAAPAPRQLSHQLSGPSRAVGHPYSGASASPLSDHRW